MFYATLLLITSAKLAQILPSLGLSNFLTCRCCMVGNGWKPICILNVSFFHVSKMIDGSCSFGHAFVLFACLFLTVLSFFF